jgi:hypothetical protein
MPNILEGVTALQSSVAEALRAAGIPEEYVSTILIAIEAGESAREADGRMRSSYNVAGTTTGRMRSPEEDREDARAIDRLVYCGHGFSARWLCPTCRHFDEIEARERYALQSEQST